MAKWRLLIQLEMPWSSTRKKPMKRDTFMGHSGGRHGESDSSRIMTDR